MSSRPIVIPAILFFFSFATILIAIEQAVQIPMGALPKDSARLATTPISHFSHAVAGAVFGIAGPIQFGRVLAKKYGRLHRVIGRVFVIAGAFLALSSFSLLWQFPTASSWLVSGGRLIFGIALAIALCIAMHSIRKKQFNRHRNWMIRSYALGIGATAVSMVFIPIYALSGTPPTGLVADIAFMGSWALCVALAEGVICRLTKSTDT